MKGSYILLIELKNDTTISIGKLGKRQFDKGCYLYVGSALNSLEQRINRHLRSDKKLYWHVDYLLQHAKVVNVFYKENKAREECNIAKTLEQQLIPITGFGCSDCSCKSHLFQGSFEEIKSSIEKLQIHPYLLNANS